MNIFLSYAEEDSRIASRIADRLTEAGHTIFNWMDPVQRGGRFRPQIEDRIRRSHAFLALLSPDFRESNWCGIELDMAIHREQRLQADDPSAAFINVAAIANVPPADAGVLGSYDWVDMYSPGKVEEGLRQLAGRFERAEELLSTAVNPGGPRPASDIEPVFRNRHDELQRVLNGLANAAGPHFWLVVAPPQLGRTWFLERVSHDDAFSKPVPWVVRLLDLRSQPAEVRADPVALLTLLFGNTSPAAAGQSPRRIAQEILRSGRPNLCLVDNAELLTEETATALRVSLGQIYRFVQDMGKRDLRLALIVASRRDDGWRGVTPPPRLSALPLTEFTPDVVQQALRELSDAMGNTFSPAEFTRNAARVHSVTEGLPALLVRCLQWVREEEWVEMDRLETQDLFEELAGPYVREELLTPASLLPDSRKEAGGQLAALVDACRVLTPYRLFTMSHLRHHLDSDAGFREALSAAGWALADLSEAISDTALLRRPLNEPWKEMHAAIRRLLFRHFYRSPEQRSRAHDEARQFVEIWADKQVGTEQVVGLVECLWHEASALCLRDPAEMKPRLSESAKKLSSALRASAAFTLDELRDFAAERMKNDGELEEVVGDGDGLLSRLVEIVLNPEDS